MREQTLPVSKAKTQFLSLVRAMEQEGRAYVLTKDGEPVGALVPMEDYEALMETNEILRDSNLMKNLKQALRQEKKGRLWKRNKKGEWVKYVD